ncbi:MAG: hypothetical protein ACTS3F_10335 [Phycisphaerales bacterium]
MGRDGSRLLGEPAVRGVLMVLVGVPLVVAVVTSVLSLETAEWLLSEGGPIEQQSVVLWIVLALFGLGVFGARSLTGWATAVVALGASAREAGFHTAFTGYSVLKIPFYYRAEHAGMARWVAVGVMVLFIAGAAVLVWRTWKRLEGHSLRALPSWALIGALGLAAGVVSKVLDRSVALVEDVFGIEAHERVSVGVHALEESIEMVLPLAFGAAVLCFVLSVAGAGGRGVSECGGDG